MHEKYEFIMHENMSCLDVYISHYCVSIMYSWNNGLIICEKYIFKTFFYLPFNGLIWSKIIFCNAPKHKLWRNRRLKTNLRRLKVDFRYTPC